MKTNNEKKNHILNCLTFQLTFPVQQEVGVTLYRKCRGHTERPLLLCSLCKHDCIAKAFSLKKGIYKN